MSRWAVPVACAGAFAIGLFFILVWAPHPWGWDGFDDYHALALSLARGDGFPTVDRPWGYAFFLAAFYRVFGDRPLIPLVVQAALNALLPWSVFRFARSEFDDRVGAVAALLTGFFCFNTVYASTQASDAICTVLFMAAVLLVARSRRVGNTWTRCAWAGLLLGVATQFRPNVILVPLVLAVFLIAEQPTPRRIWSAVALVTAAALVLLPWTVRNDRLTGAPLPTSTHGGMQLWYGTLQTGPFLASRSYNPRSVFETPTFPYTSLDAVPLVVSGQLAACAGTHAPTLTYWTDRDARRRRVPFAIEEHGAVRAEVPISPAPTTYYFVVDDGHPEHPRRPQLFFVTHDHLGDADRHGDLLDVFDVVRMARHIVWAEPLPATNHVDFDGNGRIDAADLQDAVRALLARRDVTAAIDSFDNHVVLRLSDGSTIAAPRAWSGRVTDLDVRGDLASALVHTAVPFGGDGDAEQCAGVDDLGINVVYYRAEPQAMQRYLALAADNIRREPLAYAVSVAYRAVRVFLVEGSDDPHTAYQFTGSGRIYRAAWVASVALLAVFGVGVVAARRRGASIALPLIMIAYIPTTLAFVLTNMRYSITVQPLMFVFVAAALVTAWEAVAAARGRADIGTARQP